MSKLDNLRSALSTRMVVINVVVDLLYGVIDPRVRQERAA